MYIFFISLFSVICLAVMPFFLLEQRKPSVRSLLLKMVCATGFLMVGVFARKYVGGGTYAAFMLAGLACSWFGDLGLHMQGKLKKIFFVLGVLGFLVAHVMYLLAYHEKLTELAPGTKFIEAHNLLIIFSGILIYVGIMLLTGTPIKLYMTPLLGYMFFLILMCVKAGTLALYLRATMPIACGILRIGSIFFLLSDATLGLLMFNKKLKTNFPLKIFNIATYFIAQLLLAASILFIR